jgi:DNA repair protein RadC
MSTNLIREMPPEDRPRERLQRLGAQALASAELVAILLRTGIKGRSAVGVAEELLRRHGNSLTELVHVPLDELVATVGVGPAKAIQLKAAFELARRTGLESETKEPLGDPAKAAAVVRRRLANLAQEQFLVLLLNTKNLLLRVTEVSRGSLNASIVEPREVFREALPAAAAAVILAHNHPSGDPTPSAEDVALTRRLVKAGELLNIPVFDHLILGHPSPGRPQDYVSLKELGLM